MTTSLNFASDNVGPAHPSVMDAVLAANAGDQPSYGQDAMMDDVRAKIRTTFEHPEAEVHLVATGTAANALALACYARPFDAIFCHQLAHVEVDECGAPEFYTGGAKLALAAGDDGKMTPDSLRKAMALPGDSVHQVQRGPLTLTQATEVGTLYALDEISALTAVAREAGSASHLDGARFANACAALDCTAAEMSWKAGIDIVTFGGTKNGCLGVEAVVFFDPAKAWEFELRRKRAGHLFSKNRFLSAQMQAYLTDDLWRVNGVRANATCAKLAQGLRQIPDVTLLFEPQVNMIFAQLPRAVDERARANGAIYYLEGFETTRSDEDMVVARFVCDWRKTDEDVAAFLALLR